jgi:hypothetical protein
VLPPAAVQLQSSWELYVTLLGAGYLIQYAPSAPIPGALGGRGYGSFEVSRYLSPLVDDDAPRSLQPFLQRASHVSALVAGSGFVTLFPGSSVGPGGKRSDEVLAFGVGADVYVTRWLALTGLLGHSLDALHDDVAGVDQTGHSFSASAGFGLRAGDVRFDAAYTFGASLGDAGWAKLRWGSFQGTLTAVINRRFALVPWGRALQGGGGGGIGVDVYPTQNLGVHASGYGERGELYSASDTIENRYSGRAGLSYWLTPRVRLAAFYQFTLLDTPSTPGAPGFDERDNAGELDVAVRLP